MLIEIQSDAFVSHKIIRPKITFNPGLNIVKGPDSFDNSIGKSSFMMCIDFVFGGNDYVKKLKNIVENIGHHEINFAFKFNEKITYFCRSTETHDIVTLCDEEYIKTDTQWSINQFTDWLKNNYAIVNSLSFRSIISPYFRIYNRDNLNESYPLKSHKDETEKQSIEKIIKLFDMYGPVEKTHEDAAVAEEKREAFTHAQKFDYIPKITKTKYNQNVEDVEEYKDKKLELAEKSSKNLLDLDSEKAAYASQLKAQLTIFRRQRGKLYSQLEALQKNKDLNTTTIQNDFSALSDFFPDQLNVDRLKTIETFHKTISSILTADLKDAERRIWNLINLLNVQIKTLEQELENVQNASNLSKIILDEYAAIDKAMNELIRENTQFDAWQELEKDFKEKQKLLKTILMQQALLLQATLNGEMESLNSYIFGENINAPTITFDTPSKYIFNTPNDDGTGTNFKGMVIFDLACLHLSCLPALIHDSYVLKQISKSSIEKIFELYMQADAQVFVSFDNVNNYTERTREIINAATILELSRDGNALYGKSFSKKV